MQHLGVLMLWRILQPRPSAAAQLCEALVLLALEYLGGGRGRRLGDLLRLGALLFEPLCLGVGGCGVKPAVS